MRPVVVCGQCFFCRRGEYGLCTNISFQYRVGQEAFTPYFIADEDWVHQLPPGVSFEEGALIEPLAVAVHAVRRGEIRIPANIFVQKEITLRGSLGYCWYFQVALQLVEMGALKLGELITHTLVAFGITTGL